MCGSRIVAALLLLQTTIFASTTINSDWRDRFQNVVNDNCPILSNGLREEIQSYQPIVDKIAAAIINGKYSGDTWNA